jgi:protein SCO1/2
MYLRRLTKFVAILLGALAVAGASAGNGGAPRITFALKTVAGQAVGVDDLPRRWLLVYFGYTYCPDICPSALIDLGRVLDRLGPLARQIQPVFITIDPERDTPALLAEYVAATEPRMLALTGRAAEIRAAAQQFHFYYVRYEDPALASYSIDHSSFFYLVDPQRRLVADFATPDRGAEEIAGELRRLLDPSQSAAANNNGG